MGKTKIESKEQKLTDVIPDDVLDFHLSIYQTLKQIESKNLSDFEKAIHKFSKIDNIIHSFVNDKWITDKQAQDLMHNIRGEIEAIVFEKYNLDLYLFMKSELETTKTTFNLNTGQKIVKRRLKGGKPSSYARSYLIATLCAEVKERKRNKPCYKMIADYFQNTLKEEGFHSRRIEVENRRVKKNGIILHLVEILTTYLPGKFRQN